MTKRTLVLSALLFLFAGSVLAQTVERSFYIDFGQNNVTNQGYLTNTDANGNKWNNLHGKGTAAPDKAYALTKIDLASADGAASDIKLETGTTFSTNGYSNGGLQSPKKTLLGDLAIESATQDYFFMEGSQDYGVLHFTGLNPEKAYRFHSFGSRTSDDARVAWFTFGGENVWTGEMQMGGSKIGDGGYNGNNNKILVSDPVFPDRDGNIDLTICKKTKGAMVYLNCMKIEELSGLERPNQKLTLAQKFYIDFGETSNTTRGRQTSAKDKNGNYWTNLSSGSSSSNAISAKTLAMKNSANSTSSRYRLVTTCTQYTNGIDAGGNNSPSDELLGDLAIQTATEDYMFIDNGDCRPFKFTNLNKDNCYKLYIYGSRNHTDNRITQYNIEGQHVWSGGQVTSGNSVGGEGNNGNIRNILVTDYIYPSRKGEIIINFQRVTGMAHISAMKIEEYTGGIRPEEPLEFTELKLSGNAEDVVFKSIGSNQYQAFAKLTKGTFLLSGKTPEGDVTLTCTGGWAFDLAAENAPVAFTVDKDCVARITVDAASQTLDVLPVTMNVRGSIAAGNPEIAYKGGGVWESEVTLPETSSQQWVDKTMYFALNNSEDLAIKRLKGASTRYALGMASNGQDVENIYQNAGTYTITVDMVNGVYNISAPIDENRISVFGSSVANGQGATDYMGYRYLYGQHLIRRYESGESKTRFYTSNVSIGGNTTNNLLGRYDDLIRDFGRYVIFGLSLGNEGIHGASDQNAIFTQWRDNMLKLIKMVRADGKIPVVMNNYTRGDYVASDYSYVKKLNLLIHEWDVPSFNCLGSIDKGDGQWADGYVSDTYHQNTAGHYEFFYSMVPSLFDALKAGKAMPKRNTSKSMTLAAGKMIRFSPEGTAHPFTVTARVKGGEGQVLRVRCSQGYATVSVTAEGKVVLKTPAGATLTSSNAITDTNWHNITLTSYYAQQRTLLYLDKTSAGVVNERMGEIQEIGLGGGSEREVSELVFWRSAMTPDEITAHCNGKMLKSSLEVYVPLGGEDDLENLAQGTNTVNISDAETGKLVKALGTDVRFMAETGSNGFTGDENFHSLFDGTSKKWCLNLGTGVNVIFHASQPVRLSGYKITTGADCAQYTGRNPKAWKLYGSTAAAGINADDASWELITEISNDTKLQDVNSRTYEYKLTSATSKAYTTFKWVITARKGGGDGVIQVEELTPVLADALPYRPVSISRNGGNGSGEEGSASLFDDDASTKWSYSMADGPAYVIMQTSEPIRINGYEITTAADAATNKNRNPRNWVLYGTNSDIHPQGHYSWEPIYTVKDDAVLQDKNKATYQFTADPTRKAYKYFMWVITATQGDGVLQAGEFNLYAYESAATGSSDLLTVSSIGYDTYVTPFPADFSLTENLEAFTVNEVKVGQSYVILNKVEKVPADVAVVVKAVAGDYVVKASAVPERDDVSANLLQPALSNTLVTDGQQFYALACQNDATGFYAAAKGDYIPYGKGYLLLPAGMQEQVFYFDDNETGIGEVKNERVKSEKSADAAYDLSGRQVDNGKLIMDNGQLKSGIYIVNGKKISIR
ncbi:MAG: SGNH/GDSL hydrolase family protein [Bacteroidaceae bacterium]|nr:SGNH/GDSL hydrolase family protein [Bacteroidaceae bacterium]